MIPRNFLNFFKTKSGKLIAFGGLFAMALMIFSAVRKHHAAEDDDAAANPTHTNQSQVVQSVLRLWQPFNPPVSKPEVVPVSAGKSSLSANTVLAPQNFLLAPIGLFADTTPGISAPKTLSPAFAPFGRLIPCETVITVDSSATQTPIVGLVTDNVYFGGKLIVPAGTEIHGTAQTDHQRERIASGNSWTFVWQNGEEMQIKAIALDREFENATNHTGWSLTDGSAGLRGELIKSDNLADIKLFAATFLSGAASALTEKQQTVFGSVSSPTLNNAPFAGAQAVLQTYAQGIYDSIQKNGFYVRVPSGKQFYLYVLQTIDTADASLGGSVILTDQEKSEPIQSHFKP